MIITIITIHRLLCVLVVVVVSQWVCEWVGWLVAWLLFGRLFFVLGVSWVVALSSPSFFPFVRLFHVFCAEELETCGQRVG